MPFHAVEGVERPFDLGGLGLEFLHPNTIGADCLRPLTKALVGRGADAIQIEGEQTHDEGSFMNMPKAQTGQAVDALAQDFVAFAVDSGVLRFGEFKTKAGRLSPYFFNAGLFNNGLNLSRLASFYARRLMASGIEFDMLFGPAYKGIVLAGAVSMELARLGRNVPFAYNRKEAKDHGEGGTLVGAPVQGRVLIIDDVISAGTSVRESLRLIEAAHAQPCGVLIALDRQERASENGQDAPWSAVQFVQQQLQLPVAAIASLSDLLQYLHGMGSRNLAAHTAAVERYRQTYGV